MAKITGNSLQNQTEVGKNLVLHCTPTRADNEDA